MGQKFAMAPDLGGLGGVSAGQELQGRRLRVMGRTNANRVQRADRLAPLGKWHRFQGLHGGTAEQ
jgi:hypothetical protein